MSKEKNRKRMRLMKNLKKEKRIKDEPNRLEKESLENVTKLLKDEGIQFKFNKKSTNKVSAAILDFIKPLLANVNSTEERRKIIGFAILTWNFGILKALGKTDEIDKILSEFPEKMNQKTKEQFDAFIDFKIKLFPEFNNFVVTYDLTFDDKGLMNLSVVSNNLKK